MNYETIIAEDVSAPFDRTDLAEVLGNLLENATRHAKARSGSLRGRRRPA